MKVAMLGWEFPPFLAGGLGVHCLELTTHLARLGVDLDFYMPKMPLTVGHAGVAAQHKHVRIREVEAEPGTSPYGAGKGYDANFNAAVELYNRRVVKAFRSDDADVLHAHDWITIPAALELSRRHKIPLVLTVHSLEFDRSGGFFPQTWIQRIEREGVHGADHVITVSHYTKQEVLEQYGADPTRITPIHNGVEWDRLGRVTRRRHEGNGTRRVLFLSRVSRQKGPLYFMETARRVLESEPDARFLVVGQGEMLPECIRFAVDRGFADRVSFTGFVSEDERPVF
ncbi:MAG TPA: glycosyltransferase family 4 protein, partial [Candidatus Thermoplasmatota archaeon]|nr:glycosyltransferase family 4 protein [Candidatus Thermoplasmatota archaeon]